MQISEFWAGEKNEQTHIFLENQSLTIFFPVKVDKIHRMLNQNEDLDEIYCLGPYSKKNIEVEQSYGHFIIGAPKPWGT